MEQPSTSGSRCDLCQYRCQLNRGIDVLSPDVMRKPNSESIYLVHCGICARNVSSHRFHEHQERCEQGSDTGRVLCLLCHNEERPKKRVRFDLPSESSDSDEPPAKKRCAYENEMESPDTSRWEDNSLYDEFDFSNEEPMIQDERLILSDQEMRDNIEYADDLTNLLVFPSRFESADSLMSRFGSGVVPKGIREKMNRCSISAEVNQIFPPVAVAADVLPNPQEIPVPVRPGQPRDTRGRFVKVEHQNAAPVKRVRKRDSQGRFVQEGGEPRPRKDSMKKRRTELEKLQCSWYDLDTQLSRTRSGSRR